MPIRFVRCPVNDRPVTCRVDLEGRTIGVRCPEYDGEFCRVQRRMFEAGRLSDLLGRVPASALDSRATHCVLGPEL